MVLQDWGQQTIKYVLERIERFSISSNLQNLKDLSLFIKCYPIISGGAINTSFNEAIYSKKKCINRMTNDVNECVWWCLTKLLNRNNPIYLKLKDLRYTKS